MGAVPDIAQKTLILQATPPRLPKRLRYKGTRKARLWRLRAKAIALSMTLAMATSGCSYKLDSLFGKDDKADQTASLRPAVAPAPRPESQAAAPPAENDLAYAK